jgi:transposase
MPIFIGLDVHSKLTSYEVQDGRGRVLAHGEVVTRPEGFEKLVRDHRIPKGTQVGLETGTVSFFVARILSALGLEPVVVDAHEVRLKAHRPNQKSDRRDAHAICDGIRTGIYRGLVHVPPHEIIVLRETLSRRRHFVRMRTRQVNAAKRLLRSYGLAHLSIRLGTALAWERLLARIPDSIPGLRRFVELHFKTWSTIQEQLVELDQLLEQHTEPFREKVDLLRTVPGVGPVVAATTVAVFSDVHRFPSAREAASYVGLVPSSHQSGDRDHRGHITKRGSSELRSMLTEAAQQASRVHHPLNPYFRKLCAKRGYRLAIVAVAHRLARILYAMLRDGRPFDIERAGVEVEKSMPRPRKTAVRTYKLRSRSAA